jgi:hypothetical protein
MDKGKPCVECNGHTKDGLPFGKKIVVVLEDPDHSGYWPVFITSNYRGDRPRLTLEDEPDLVAFTDEPIESLDAAATAHANQICPEQGSEFVVWNISKQDFIAGAQWQARQSADAIRKDRERIWREFQDLWPYELNDKARKMIFGEKE